MSKTIELNLQIHVTKDDDGNMTVDCHCGNDTIFPPGTATCIADEEDYALFLFTLQDLIDECMDNKKK